MGDMADMYRGIKEIRKKAREEHGIKCWLCQELYPKREPTVLLPGRKCKVCDYQDTRPWLDLP